MIKKLEEIPTIKNKTGKRYDIMFRELSEHFGGVGQFLTVWEKLSLKLKKSLEEIYIYVFNSGNDKISVDKSKVVKYFKQYKYISSYYRNKESDLIEEIDRVFLKYKRDFIGTCDLIINSHGFEDSFYSSKEINKIRIKTEDQDRIFCEVLKIPELEFEKKYTKEDLSFIDFFTICGKRIWECHMNDGVLFEYINSPKIDKIWVFITENKTPDLIYEGKGDSFKMITKLESRKDIKQEGLPKVSLGDEIFITNGISKFKARVVSKLFIDKDNVANIKYARFNSDGITYLVGTAHITMVSFGYGWESNSDEVKKRIDTRI